MTANWEGVLAVMELFIHMLNRITMDKYELIRRLAKNYEDKNTDASIADVDAYTQALLQKTHVLSCEELLEQELNRLDKIVVNTFNNDRMEAAMSRRRLVYSAMLLIKELQPPGA